MFGISCLDISGALGLCATALLSFNFLLGMLLSTAYKRSVYWKNLPPVVQQISMDRLHNWTAYIALFFVVLHPLFLVAGQKAGFYVTRYILARSCSQTK